MWAVPDHDRQNRRNRNRFDPCGSYFQRLRAHHHQLAEDFDGQPHRPEADPHRSDAQPRRPKCHPVVAKGAPNTPASIHNSTEFGSGVWKGLYASTVARFTFSPNGKSTHDIIVQGANRRRPEKSALPCEKRGGPDLVLNQEEKDRGHALAWEGKSTAYSRQNLRQPVRRGLLPPSCRY
jgi:hypothetical protein